MQSPLEGIFDEAENRYLKPEDLQVVGQYVASLSERMSAYQTVRDRELNLIQQAADQLQQELPSVGIAVLERSVKNGMLALRHAAMAMLLDDASFVQKQLGWLGDSIQLHHAGGTSADEAFFRLMKQQLRGALTAQQLALLEPFLSLVEAVIPVQEEMLTVAGIF